MYEQHKRYAELTGKLLQRIAIFTANGFDGSGDVLVPAISAESIDGNDYDYVRYLADTLGEMRNSLIVDFDIASDNTSLKIDTVRKINEMQNRSSDVDYHE